MVELLYDLNYVILLLFFAGIFLTVYYLRAQVKEPFFTLSIKLVKL